VLPFNRHAQVVRNGALESPVLGVFIDELTTHLRTRDQRGEPLPRISNSGTPVA
jgi:hypothetical protein